MIPSGDYDARSIRVVDDIVVDRYTIRSSHANSTLQSYDIIDQKALIYLRCIISTVERTFIDGSGSLYVPITKSTHEYTCLLIARKCVVKFSKADKLNI